MISAGGRIGRCLVPIALIAASVGLGSAEEAAPSYLYLLAPPVVGDNIGFANSVTADLVTGEVFVCDSRRARILIFDSDGHFRYQIRGGSDFSAPRDLAVDPDGYLFVLANYKGPRALLQLDFDGKFIRQIQFSGQPRSDDVVSNLTSIAISPSGDRLYIVDSNRHEVWITDRDGNVLHVIELAAGLTEENRQDQILGRVDIYNDRMLLGMPTEARVRVYDLEGEMLTSVGQRGSAPCHVARPMAGVLDAEGTVIAIDSQRMAVVAFEQGVNRCVGDYLAAGTLPGNLYYPIDIALDAMGRLYVSQGFEGRVQAFRGFAPAAEPPPPLWEIWETEEAEAPQTSTDDDGPNETGGP